MNKTLFPPLLLSLFMLTATLGLAQDKPLIGHIIDAKTKQPVLYAAVRLREHDAFSLSGESGRFVLRVPSKVTRDSLLITIPGYQRKAQAWQKGGGDSLVIELAHLQPEPFHTDYPGMSVQTLTLGTRAKKPGEGMIQGSPGSQYALFIKNGNNRKLGYVRSVSFFIAEQGSPKESFRVRLYKANGPANAPGTDLLNESVVTAAPAGGKWFTVDLAAYTIPASQEGFYVAMEWILGAGSAFYYVPDFQDSYTPYGQVLRPTFEFKESLTWNYTLGRGWHQITLTKGKNRYNVMMRAEVVASK